MTTIRKTCIVINKFGFNSGPEITLAAVDVSKGRTISDSLDVSWVFLYSSNKLGGLKDNFHFHFFYLNAFLSIYFEGFFASESSRSRNFHGENVYRRPQLHSFFQQIHIHFRKFL